MRARTLTVGAMLVAASLLWAGCGSDDGMVTAPRTLADPAGDPVPATAPDITSVTVERDDQTITFRVEFAGAPPLSVNEDEDWVDMLLIGVDVPPDGPAPRGPGGEWRGADYALGSHGPSTTGSLVRLSPSDSGDEAAARKRASIAVETDGTTVALPVAREALGDPATMRVSIAAAREWNDEGDAPSGATADIAPDTGTWRVDFGD